jgi:uncharacterized membrane protein YsdA (DUF1294 family)/cold shock CspA family protein
LTSAVFWGDYHPCSTKKGDQQSVGQGSFFGKNMRAKGKIASWNNSKGYGFITSLAGKKQIFIHINAFANKKRLPKVGEVVTYSISTDKQGRPRAANATLSGMRLQHSRKNNKGTFSIVLAALFLTIVGISVLTGILPAIILVIYLALGLTTYIVYTLDKSAAKSQNWRTPEQTLHLLAIAGGWPGALIAQQKLRHKSRKKEFRFIFWLTVLINCGMFIWLFTENGSLLLNRLVLIIA